MLSPAAVRDLIRFLQKRFDISSKRASLVDMKSMLRDVRSVRRVTLRRLLAVGSSYCPSSKAAITTPNGVTDPGSFVLPVTQQKLGSSLFCAHRSLDQPGATAHTPSEFNGHYTLVAVVFRRVRPTPPSVRQQLGPSSHESRPGGITGTKQQALPSVTRMLKTSDRNSQSTEDPPADQPLLNLLSELAGRRLWAFAAEENCHDRIQNTERTLGPGRLCLRPAIHPSSGNRTSREHRASIPFAGTGHRTGLVTQSSGNY